MKLDMHPLLSGETDVLAFSYALPLPTAGAQSGILDCLLFSDVTFSVPMQVRGEVKNMAGYMVLSCAVEVEYETNCARCAVPLHRTLSYTFEKPVADTQGDIRLRDENNDDYVRMEDGMLDLDTPVLDQLFLEFPMKHLCHEDCAGLCPICGQNRNEGTCDCDQKQIDPRFASLRRLLDEGAFADEELTAAQTNPTQQEIT